MKIIQYLGTLGACGAESVIKDYALELHKRGHEVIVPIYYTTPDSPNQKALEAENIRVDVIRGQYIRKLLPRIYNKCLTYLGYNRLYLKKLIRKEQPDVLHLHGYVLGDLKNLLKQLKNVSLFYTCHNPPNEFFDGKWKFQYKIAKRLIDECGLQMIALTQEMAEEINSLFGITNTVVLNNPIDIDRFLESQIDKECIRKELGIAQSAFVIGHVGRFHEQKNHMFLVEIFNEVYKQNKNAFLLLIASSEIGEQDRVLNKLKEYHIENRCLILYDRADVEKLYRAMDVFVFPSLFEGLGLALLEAQVSGLRCVVSTGIPQSAIVSDNVQVLSLKESTLKWAKACLVGDEYMQSQSSIEEYRLGSVIDVLERMYKKND